MCCFSSVCKCHDNRSSNFSEYYGRSTLSKVNGQATSSEEVNLKKIKAELAIGQSLGYVMECEGAMFCRVNCHTNPVVFETVGSADNVTIDCSEMELPHTTNSDDDTTLTKSYINLFSNDMSNSVDETTDMSTTRKNFILTSQERATLQDTDITINKKESSLIDVMPFESHDNGSIHNELTIGIFSSPYNRNFYHLTNNPGRYGESNRANQPLQETLPKPVTGM